MPKRGASKAAAATTPTVTPRKSSATSSKSAGKQPITARVGKSAIKKTLKWTRPKPSGQNTHLDRNTKKKGAMCEFIPARAQKDSPFHKAGDLTGNVLWRARPIWGNNEIFKAKVLPHLLAEGNAMRFHTQDKVFYAKVSTPEQAIKVREAQKQVSKEDEAALQSAPTDEQIHSIFDFPEANTAEIKIVASTDVTGTETKAILGDTYAWKDILNKTGFTWHKPTQMWHGPTGTDTTELEAKMQDYGFHVEEYGNLSEDDEDEDEDEDDEEEEPGPVVD